MTVPGHFHRLKPPIRFQVWKIGPNHIMWTKPEIGSVRICSHEPIYIIFAHVVFLMQQVLEHTRTILQWMESWKTIGAKLSGRCAATPPDGYLSHGQGRSRFTKDLVVEWGHVPDDISPDVSWETPDDTKVIQSTNTFAPILDTPLEKLGLALDLFFISSFSVPLLGDMGGISY